MGDPVCNTISEAPLSLLLQSPKSTLAAAESTELELEVAELTRHGEQCRGRRRAKKKAPRQTVLYVRLRKQIARNKIQ